MTPRQLYMDLGQKNFAGVDCKECGMRYDPSFPQEVALHRKFHQESTRKYWKTNDTAILLSLKLANGRKVRVVLAKTFKDSLKQSTKIVVDWIEQRVGSAPMDYAGSSVYLMLSEEKEVIGMCGYEPITKAHSLTGKRMDARFGIQFIWIRDEWRRQKLAQVLIRAVVLSHSVSAQQLAFYCPTDEGLLLAKKIYNCDSDALVYGTLHT